MPFTYYVKPVEALPLGFTCHSQGPRATVPWPAVWARGMLTPPACLMELSLDPTENVSKTLSIPAKEGGMEAEGKKVKKQD